MSDSPQDENTLRAATAKKQPVTQNHFESTPVIKKYGPDLAFTSTVANSENIKRQLASEMEGRWFGAMPVDDFLETYLAKNLHPLPTLADNPFGAVPSSGMESAHYDPFITAISGWIPHLQAVNTSTKQDTEHNLKLKPDISVYNRVAGVAAPDKTDFARMELWMEFKTNSSGVAFHDPRDTSNTSRLLAIEHGSFTPDTVDGINARGQLTLYAGAHHSLQFRHFSFSVSVEGDRARFLRWDPSGTVLTAAFNYRTNPEIMADFLWRFDHLGAQGRGHDESIRPVQLADDIDARVREKLNIKDKKTPLFEYDVCSLEGVGHAYGPWPSSQNRSLVSRCTRSLSAVWIPNADANSRSNSCAKSEPAHDAEDEKDPWCRERLIFLKDTWRFLSNSPGIKILPEHEIYAELHVAKTPNIAKLVTGGDVEGGKTKTQEMVDAPWLCVRPQISPSQHYRLILGTIGRSLTTFRCTKELVTGVLDAIKAHWHAFNVAKILHGDISVGNIIVTDSGNGLLTDWELAKRTDEVGSRRPNGTGNWEFLSAKLLQNPGSRHVLADDLESFLHVLGWTTLRFLPAIDSYTPLFRGRDMVKFDEQDRLDASTNVGGDAKSSTLGSGQYPSQRFQPRKPTPLYGLIRKLSSPLKSLYAVDPPENVGCADMECLKSSVWFMTTIKLALEEGTWPTDDGAAENLPIIISKTFSTSGQDIQRAIQLLDAANQLAESKMAKLAESKMARSSKRTASPAPEPSAKRHHSMPAAPGSGN